MAGPLPELTIVLFNTDSSDKLRKGAAKYRYDSMNIILDDVLIHKPYPNLFVLAQENIRGKLRTKVSKHRILYEKLGHVDQPFPVNKEAGVYYHHGGSYIVSYSTVRDMESVLEAIGFQADSEFTIARLMACVLTPGSGSGRKILLVSWHGPSTVSEQSKEACFDRLVRFSENLRRRETCDIVLVGGDFNLAKASARRLMDTLRTDRVVDGAVLADYTTTEDRQHLDIIDYVVYWPEGSLQVTEPVSVIMPKFRRQKKNRPFDHPIVHYRFGDAAFVQLTRQFRNITVYEDEPE